MKVSQVEINKLSRIFNKLINDLFKQKHEELRTNFRLLENSNVSKIFSKGFVKVEKPNGQHVPNAKNLSLGDKLSLIFLDGKINVKVTD